jgi:hypothetical protein
MKTLTNRALIAAAILAAAAFIVGYGQQQQDSGGKYAEVNGLKMYYEIHGSGRPLVLLHGAFGFAEGWGADSESERNGKAPSDSCVPRSLKLPSEFCRLINWTPVL